jgi:hypothetical protein
MIALRMFKPITVVLLGADRVGKSTIVTNTIKKLEKDGFGAKALHFSGPQPHHSSPIQQYIEPFDSVLETMPEFVLCDRGFSEVCFYDKFRRHISISHEWAQAAESYFLERSSNVKVFLLEREWEWSQPHHLIEVREEYPNATAWWIKNKMKAREAEHYAYYDYMHNYLNHYSLLPHTVLRDTDRDFSLFDRLVFV